MSIIKRYNEGSNISLLDVRYINGKQRPDNKDFMYLIYKDLDTGKKHHEIINKVEYEYFMAKPEEYIDHNMLFIEKEKVVPIVVEYRNLLKDIAERNNLLDFYYDNARTNYANNNKLHQLYNVFNSDMNIEDHYRYRFDKIYKNESILNLSKLYFDIEVDIKTVANDPELGKYSINATSIIFENKVYVFLLRDEENPLIEEFEKSINQNLFKELQDFIIYAVGGEKQSSKFKVDNLEFSFAFYNEEIELIKDIFKVINFHEPDFVLAWNMAFDIPYIIERIKILGYDPADIICHPSFGKNKHLSYYIDERHRNEYEARGDRYDITSHSIYLDQLIHFASRRKGQSAFPNFKLDTAGSIIAKVRKLDYTHITSDLGKLPTLDYKTFVFYNIVDTIVQKCIEESVQDINFIYNKCTINNTRYDKCHRQTVYLTNRATKSFYNDGFIIGNNINKQAIKTIFEGALIGNPDNNSDYSKVKLYNQILNIALNLLDFDYKALYPSITLQGNYAPNTLIGRIIILNQVYKNENPFRHELEEKINSDSYVDYSYKLLDTDDLDGSVSKRIYNRGGNYIEDLISENVIEFCHRWLHYANFREWLQDFEYYFTNIKFPLHVKNIHRLFDSVPNKNINLFTKVNKEYDKYNLFTYYPEKLNYENYLDKLDRSTI